MAVPRPKATIEYIEIGVDDEFELDWQDKVLAVEGTVSMDDNRRPIPTLTLTILRRPGQ